MSPPRNTAAPLAQADRPDVPLGSPSTAPVAWHCLDVATALDRLDSSDAGLSQAEAASRLISQGRNELEDRGSKRPLALLWEQLTAVMVVILIAAAALSLVLGKFLEAGAIAAIVALFTLLGFLQEYRAERAIAALRRLAVPTVRVRRNAGVMEVPAAELVPGDVVELEAGNVVPADLRLIAAVNLRIQEAALTGESEPVDKTTDVVAQPEAALGDRHNLAFASTQVTAGRGAGIVVATGMGTQLGRIATLLQSVAHEPTPLQVRLDKVGKQLAVAGVAVALIVVAIGAASGEALADLLLTAISVAVAVIPEGLPAVVTFTLAVGAQRMLRRQALIRKLPAVETLGSVTVICSDKTGTLTQNRMTVSVIEVAGHRLDAEALAAHGSPETLAPAVRLVLAAGALCNDAVIAGDDQPETIGDPTETSLLVAAMRAGIDLGGLRAHHPRLAELPFDSTRKRMSTVHGGAVDGDPLLGPLAGPSRLALVKGAIDGLLARSTHVWTDSGPVPLNDEWRARVDAANASMAAGGMRVLAVAYRSLEERSPLEVIEDDLTFLGLFGIIDPPRPEVRDAVALCRRAGVRPVMITGDHPLTASAIAADLGISLDGAVLTGADIDALDDRGLEDAAETVSVFARVSPEHKLRVVDALRRRGHVVAMTGDGVNDAPALKKADIGVAMGITGTDVSKEASDMVLRDDNFTTIVAAVEEGRVIYDNLRRFVRFAVAGNIGKMVVMIGWPLPFLLGGDVGDHAVALLPLQLLWLNLMTDGLLGLSMGLEPAERGVMARPPHRPGASIWAGGLGRQAAWVGALIGLASLAVGYAYHEAGRAEWQTMIVTSLTFLQVFQAIGTRSTDDSLRSIGLRSNPLLVAAVGVVVGLQVLAIASPLREFLDLTTLGLADIALCVALGFGLLAAIETEKLWHRRRRATARGSAI